jgi:WD40 repeat protein
MNQTGQTLEERMTSSQRLTQRIEKPTKPYRGVLPFRFVDRPIFTGRAEETRAVFQLVCVYRGVLLYGDSGSGKSSLVNAGVIPDLIQEGFAVERLRVQPVLGEEIVIERIALSESRESDALPSMFTQEERSHAHLRRTASVEDLMHALEEHHSAAMSGGEVRVLIFDQFEELVTQFEDAQADRAAYDHARKVQGRVVDVLHRLLAAPRLGVKVLMVFRDDYFGRLAELFPAFPQIKEQSLRLTSPSVESLRDIIQKPFEAVSFTHQLSEKAQAHLIAGFKALSKNGLVNLTEVQIACASLWDNPRLEEDFLAKPEPRTAVEWIFEGYGPRTIEKLPEDLRNAAVAALCRLITPATVSSSGTRNIVSEINLTTGLQNEDGYAPEVIEKTLTALCDDARLVFRHTRGTTPFYEIVSEFLVRGIAAKRSGVEKAREQRRALQLQAEVDRQTAELTAKNSRLRTRTYGVVAALVASLVLAGVAYYKSEQAEISRNYAEAKALLAEEERDNARRERENADAERKQQIEQLLAQRDREQQQLQSRLKETETKLLATAVVNEDEVKRVFDQAIKEIKDPLVSRLTGAMADVTIAEYSPDGRFIAVGAADKKIRLWNRLGEKSLAETIASSSTGGVTTLAFSPDSSMLLSGSSGSTLRLFDPRQSDLGAGKEIKLHSDTITHVEFSPNGKFSVSSSADGSVALLDWSMYPKVIPLKSLANWQHEKAVTFATFSADGSRVVTSADDSETKVFETSGRFGLVPASYGGSPINPLDVDPGAASHTPVRKMRFSPVDRDFVVGGAGNRKVVWLSLKGDRIALFRDDGKSGPFFHEGAVLDVAFRPNGTHVASVATDGLCLIWDAATAKTIASVPTEIQGRLFGVEWQKDDLLALVGEDGWLELWDMKMPATPRQVFAMPAHKGVARGVRFDPLGRQVLTWSGYQDGYTNESLPYLPDAKGKAASLKFAGKDRPADNTAAIWDIESARSRGWAAHPAP